MIVDSIGNEIKPGDVLVESTGGFSFYKSEYKYHLKIWEMPEFSDGFGYHYNYEGIKSIFYWAKPHKSIKIDMSIMPDGFEYSFKHGMCDIYTTIEKGTVLELIENSNWKNYEVRRFIGIRDEFLRHIKEEAIPIINARCKDYKKYFSIEGMFRTIIKESIRKVNDEEINVEEITEPHQYIKIVNDIIDEKVRGISNLYHL